MLNHGDVVGLSLGHAMISYDVCESHGIIQDHAIPHEDVLVVAASNTVVTQVQVWCNHAFLQVLSELIDGDAHVDIVFADELPRGEVLVEFNERALPRPRVRRARRRHTEPASKLGEMRDQ